LTSPAGRAPASTSRAGGKCILSTVLDHRREARERIVPLPGYALKIGLSVHDRLRIEGEAVLATGFDGLHDARALEHAQVLVDGLPRRPGPDRESGDRLGFAFRELCQQAKPGLGTSIVEALANQLDAHGISNTAPACKGSGVKVAGQMPFRAGTLGRRDQATERSMRRSATTV